ncbi:hypothetical protein Pan44_38520 [Caulifigura coniformis]|uniref:Uncharacterized protein n=1 Tax=Caulifigura coniformis TaxID=2527983 RepID=A0A517SI51_9PLAN|nr:hypothetical protein [Caulifigura coniformis]QDT55804.1 hypothetical protein Pan44_38520 [Caulifigura coniformis]
MAAASNSPAGDNRRPSAFRPGDSVSRRVLEDVIRQTASLYSFETPTDPADLAPLRDVATKLKGADFGLEPVVIELVTAMLRRQLKGLWTSEEQLSSVAGRVAETLFENPETSERLEKLWARLNAEVA